LDGASFCSSFPAALAHSFAHISASEKAAHQNSENISDDGQPSMAGIVTAEWRQAASKSKPGAKKMAKRKETIYI